MRRVFLALLLSGVPPTTAFGCGSFQGSSAASTVSDASNEGPDAATGDASPDRASADDAPGPQEPEGEGPCGAGGTRIWRESFEQALTSDWVGHTQPQGTAPADSETRAGRVASGGLMSKLSGGAPANTEVLSVRQRALQGGKPTAVEFWVRSEDAEGNLVFAQVLGSPGHNIQLSRSQGGVVLGQQANQQSITVTSFRQSEWQQIRIRINGVSEDRDGEASKANVTVSVGNGDPHPFTLPFGQEGLALQLGAFAQSANLTDSATYYYDDASHWACSSSTGKGQRP